jgi:hypothetical protein
MYKKVVFMHIAKTAGSAINDIFEHALGTDKFIAHAERKLDDLQNTFSNVDFLSGHIYYTNLKSLLDNDVYLFTIIREPISHLASHILWLDHYNLPEKKRECNMLNKSTQEVVYQIKNTNLNDYREIDYFLVHIKDFGIRLLDNCQTRYFIGTTELITMKDIDIAIKASQRFNKIIFQDNLIEGINSVVKDLSLEDKLVNYDFSKKVNEAKSSRKIDTSRPIIRDVLKRRVSVDNRLYNMIKNRQKLI